MEPARPRAGCVRLAFSPRPEGRPSPFGWLQGTSAQRGDLAEHSDAIARDVDLAPLVMVPAHRDFLHPQVRFPAEIKELDVETESIGLRRFEDWAENVEAKCFEAALGIPVRQPGREPHDQIENTAALFPQPRLALADQAALQCARSEGHVEFAGCNGFDQLRSLLDRCR